MKAKTMSRSDAVMRMCAIEDEIDDLEVEGFNGNHPSVKRLRDEREFIERHLQSDADEIPVQETCCVCNYNLPKVGPQKRKVFCYKCYYDICALFAMNKTARQIAQRNDWLAREISHIAPPWAQLEDELKQ